MKTIPYTCKFCDKPGQVHYDESYEVEARRLAGFLKIACNRCADFEVIRRKLERAIYRATDSVISARHPWVEMSARTEAEDKARPALRRLATRYAELVCAHYRVPVVLDPEFAAMLMDKPDKAWSILSHYRAMAVKAAAAPPPELVEFAP